LGASGRGACRSGLGYAPNPLGGGAAACAHGAYKYTIGSAPCSPCPAGTTTTKPSAAVRRGQCDACRPGFGAAGGRVDASDPRCALCPSGSLSGGYKAGGQPCEPCAGSAGYGGRMVSRPGASSPSDCYNEFVTDASAASNSLAWDLIQMGPAALARQPGLDTAADCQDACAASVDCQASRARGRAPRNLAVPTATVPSAAA
jgi:hypothetical protein